MSAMAPSIVYYVLYSVSVSIELGELTSMIYSGLDFPTRRQVRQNASIKQLSLYIVDFCRRFND